MDFEPLLYTYLKNKASKPFFFFFPPIWLQLENRGMPSNMLDVWKVRVWIYQVDCASTMAALEIFFRGVNFDNLLVFVIILTTRF